MDGGCKRVSPRKEDVGHSRVKSCEIRQRRLEIRMSSAKKDIRGSSAKRRRRLRSQENRKKVVRKMVNAPLKLNLSLTETEKRPSTVLKERRKSNFKYDHQLNIPKARSTKAERDEFKSEASLRTRTNATSDNSKNFNSFLRKESISTAYRKTDFSSKKVLQLISNTT